MDEAERQAVVQRTLDEMIASDRIIGCAVLTLDGFVIAVAADPAFINQVGDVGARLHGIGQRASVALELGELEEHVIVGKKGTVMIRPLDRREMMVVVAAEGAPLGWVRVTADTAIATLRKASA